MSTTANDLFDPADMETVEPTPPTHTPEAAYIPDTNADPEGAEVRAEKPAISLPDFFFKRYHLDDNGNPQFNVSVVVAIMQVFDAKKDTIMQVFNSIGDSSELEASYYESQVDSIVDGLMPLLEVDPQSTGINFLGLCTRTWAEFTSIAYEYSDSLAGLKADSELPEWLITREEKMMQLGRKARLLRDAIARVDNKFGLKSTSLDRKRVQIEVERRLQRLSEWNFSQHADTSGKVSAAMNKATVNHCESVFANA